MLTYGDNLLRATAVESFWNAYFSLPDPFDGLVYRRESTQETDTYTRLGSAPMPEEWAGDRKAKTAPEYSYDIANKPYDSTVEIDKKLIKYEQWDEVRNHIANQGTKARAHKPKLMSALLMAGWTAVCEDGQYYFDDTHADVGAEYTTTQDNALTANISDPAAPTDINFHDAIAVCMDSVADRKDDRGDPMGIIDAPENWVVMVAPTHWQMANRVLKADLLTGSVGNDLKGRFTVRLNQWLTGTDRFYFFYAGSNHKPILLQETGGLEFNDDEDSKSGNFAYSATWWGRVQYGQWRTAVGFIWT